MREILAELATLPILVFSNGYAVAEGSRRFHVYCDAYIDGFGAPLETGSGGRLHKTHRVHQPSYAQLGKSLGSSSFGGQQHRLDPQRLRSYL